MPESYEERIDLPGGQSLWYIDEHPTDPKSNHSYWRHNPKTGRKGRRLTGVTTIVKTLDYDPKNLLKWAAQTQCIGIAQLFNAAAVGGDVGLADLSWLSSQESIWAALEDYSLTFEDVRDRAAKRGTNVHKVAFQALGMGRPVPDLERLTPEEQGHARAIMAFWLDYEPEASHVEQIVYSERLGVAGRLDFLGKLKGIDGLCVVDAKTGKFIGAGAHAQVGGGYPLLSAESGLVPACSPSTLATVEKEEERVQAYCSAASRLGAYLLQTREDGTYELIPAEGRPEHFEAAVTAYRAAGAINGAAGRAWKARQTERETERQIAELVRS